jgi:hypothetical protein
MAAPFSLRLDPPDRAVVVAIDVAGTVDTPGAATTDTKEPLNVKLP